MVEDVVGETAGSRWCFLVYKILFRNIKSFKACICENMLPGALLATIISFAGAVEALIVQRLIAQVTERSELVSLYELSAHTRASIEKGDNFVCFLDERGRLIL